MKGMDIIEMILVRQKDDTAHHAIQRMSISVEVVLVFMLGLVVLTKNISPEMVLALMLNLVVPTLNIWGEMVLVTTLNHVVRLTCHLEHLLRGEMSPFPVNKGDA
jgi:hypothetical protein